MHLTTEIDYEELVETARRPQPFWARLRDLVVLEIPEISSSEFRPTNRGASDPSGQIRLLIRDGSPWVRVHPGPQGFANDTDRLAQALLERLGNLGLVHSGRKSIAATPLVRRPTVRHTGRLESIRAVAQDWVDANLLVADGQVLEVGRLIPSDDAVGIVPPTAALSIVPATMPGSAYAVDELLSTAERTHAATSSSRQVAFSRHPGLTRIEQSGRTIQAKFARALADNLEQLGNDDPTAACEKMAVAAALPESGPPRFLNEDDMREHRDGLFAPIPFPGLRVAADRATDGRYRVPDSAWGGGGAQTLIQISQDGGAPNETSYNDDQTARLTISYFDGSGFLAKPRRLLLDEWNPSRDGPLPPAPPILDPEVLLTHANIVGPMRRRRSTAIYRAYGEAVHSRPWSEGKTPKRDEIAAMFREFCARLLVAPHPDHIYMRIPEPVLRVDIRPDGSPEFSYCYSWRRRFEARPEGGGPVPFIFPLPSYDDAIAFMELLDRTPTKTAPRPVMDVTSVFSPSFDEWNLKAALVHLLSAEEGPLALLPTPTIEAGVRVSQLLDLWCVDTAAARSFQHGSFLNDCGELLDGIAHPIFGRSIRPLLHRFAAEIVERLRQRDLKSAAVTQEDDHVSDASGFLPSPG